VQTDGDPLRCAMYVRNVAGKNSSIVSLATIGQVGASENMLIVTVRAAWSCWNWCTNYHIHLSTNGLKKHVDVYVRQKKVHTPQRCSHSRRGTYENNVADAAFVGDLLRNLLEFSLLRKVDGQELNVRVLGSDFLNQRKVQFPRCGDVCSLDCLCSMGTVCTW
jgi:hypothetical protein